MAGLSDILGSGEAVKKLIQTVENGVGRIYDDTIGPVAEVRRKKLLSAAETEIQHEQVIAQTRSLLQADEIAQRAGKRVLIREIRRQNNIEKIVSLASTNLEGEMSPEPVSTDWATRFFEIAQDINEENIQKVWAKILAGEIKKPGTFSLRTLETLRNITKEEAEIFSKNLCPLVFDGAYIVRVGGSGDFREVGLNYASLLGMQEAGLLLNADDIVQTLKDEKEIKLDYHSQSILCKSPKNEFELPILMLTSAGQELFKIQHSPTHAGHFQAVKDFLTKKGFTNIRIQNLRDSKTGVK